MARVRRHHTISAGLIRRFARDRQITAHPLAGEARTIGARGVGFQTDYWGQGVAQQLEDSFGKGETAALRTLRSIEDEWPLGHTGRGRVSELVAIHVIRTPAFGAFVRAISERSIREVISAEAERDRASAAQLEEAGRYFRGEESHARTLVGQVSRIGSLVGSMHWSLVMFQDDWLITSDQPVLILPNAEAHISPASSVPVAGFSNTIEVCFTLDPKRLLLMTWYDEPDDGPPLRGTYGQAASVNWGLRTQALQEWFSKPGTRPAFYAWPLLTPNLYALSTELLRGYTRHAAIRSRRRHATEEMLNTLIVENAPRDRMRWVRVGRREAA